MLKVPFGLPVIFVHWDDLFTSLCAINTQTSQVRVDLICLCAVFTTPAVVESILRNL